MPRQSSRPSASAPKRAAPPPSYGSATPKQAAPPPPAAAAQVPPPAAAAAAQAPAAAAEGEKSDVHKQVEEASAVRCAAIVKEKGDKFTTRVQLAALHTMATKSSWHLRAELIKQPHVRKLFERVAAILKRPPAGLDIETLSQTAWDLIQFPEEVRGDGNALLGAAAESLSSAKPSSWRADAATKVLFSLAKAEAIQQQKPLVSRVVAEMVADKGRRANKELSHEGLVNLLFSVGCARQHIVKGDHPMVHIEANDETLFEIASARVMREMDSVDVKLLASLAHTHAMVGIRNEALFKAMCPRILARQKELNDKAMGKVIKAYTRFMIPLREQAQGFRTMAVVAKGDFIRPSDKPEGMRKKTYDHPVALYSKTQLHQRA
mmetsp:Transcript_85068/g.237577  ORF Transcript_85068/g.237577 Transcript_85068/m.237577 type:complete len:378 (+) Transcript_85068:98-1231(+)